MTTQVPTTETKKTTLPYVAAMGRMCDSCNMLHLEGLAEMLTVSKDDLMEIIQVGANITGETAYLFSLTIEGVCVPKEK